MQSMEPMEQQGAAVASTAAAPLVVAFLVSCLALLRFAADATRYTAALLPLNGGVCGGGVVIRCARKAGV